LVFRSEYQAVAQADPQDVSEFTDGAWIPTGDLAEPGADGRWRLLGRAGEIFKRYGEKIALSRILTTVAHAWGGQASAYRERDPAGEEGYVLVVSPPPSAADLSALLRAFRSDYGRAHWPLRIESTPAIPALSNGKTDTHALRTLTDTTAHWRQRIQ
jgi:acyl-CoA synthetase (AMP-forming)/AMP-acid ligase II